MSDAADDLRERDEQYADHVAGRCLPEECAFCEDEWWLECFGYKTSGNP